MPAPRTVPEYFINMEKKEGRKEGQEGWQEGGKKDFTLMKSVRPGMIPYA